MMLLVSPLLVFFFFPKRAKAVVYTVTTVGNDFNFGCYAAPVQCSLMSWSLFKCVSTFFC